MMLSVFSIYFLNYGVLYMLVPMKVDLPLVSKSLTGVYPDFNQHWFADIGSTIIETMTINAVIPPIELLFLGLWAYVRRAYDQGSLCLK